MPGPEFNPADDVQPTKDEWERAEAINSVWQSLVDCGRNTDEIVKTLKALGVTDEDLTPK